MLLLLALALVLPALLKPPSRAVRTTDSAAQANLSVLRSQLTQLDADLAAGSLNADQLALAKSEIERRALEEDSSSASSLTPVPPAQSTRTAWLVGLGIPLLALGLYGFLGNLQALDSANLQAKTEVDPTPEQIEAMVSALANRLEALPAHQTPDPKAWEMLARAYAAMQKFPEARKAYSRAVELNPGNAQMLADYADVAAMSQGQSMVGEPTELFERALALEPNNLKALALAGSAAFERKNFAEAAQFWEKASQLAPPGSDFAKSLISSTEEARAASASASGVGKFAPVAGASARIEGVVSLALSLKHKVAPEDTVFIFARAAEGPRMPLAIVRRQASELPISFTLDDSTAMSNELKLSKFSRIVVAARVSRSGNATPQSGDLVGQTGPVTIGAGPLMITIENVQP